MESQNHPPSPSRRQQRPQPLQQPEKVGLRTKLPAGIMMLSPKEAVSSPRPVLGQLSNSNGARAFTSSSDEDSYANSQFSGTAKSKHSYGVPEASPSPDKLWRTPADSSAPSSLHTSPEFNHYRSRMQTSPSGHPSPTDTDMYMDEEHSLASSATTSDAPTDMYTFATAAASILQQAREEEDAQSASDASSAASADATPLKNYRSAPMPNWTNRNDGSVMDSYRKNILGTPPAPSSMSEQDKFSMMTQQDKYGNDLNPLSPFRPDYTYSEDEESALDVSSDSSTQQTSMYPARYSPGDTNTPSVGFPGDKDETPVRKNISPPYPAGSPYRVRVGGPPDQSAIDWQNYNDASPPRGLPSMLGDSDSLNTSGAELESPARFLKSTREEPLVEEEAVVMPPKVEESLDEEEIIVPPPKVEETLDEEEPTEVVPSPKESSPAPKSEQSNEETPELQETPKAKAPDLNELYSKPGLMSPGEQSLVFALDDCKALAKQAETPGAKSIEFSLDVCQADPELAMKPFLQQSKSGDSTVPEDVDEDGMFEPDVVKKGGESKAKGAKTRAATKKKRKGDKEAPSAPSNRANAETSNDEDKATSGCCNFSLRCKLFGLLFLALLVFVPILIGKWRERALAPDEMSDFQNFPTYSPVATAAPSVERPTTRRPTNKGSGTREPSQSPVSSPSAVTLEPTLPTVETKAPTLTPVTDPTVAPVVTETVAPTSIQTGGPTQVPTITRTNIPTQAPTASQSGVPTQTPTDRPTSTPTIASSGTPTRVPTQRPTTVPTIASSAVPTQVPTVGATNVPSLSPSVTVTDSPTSRQTDAATPTPSVAQTRRPTTTGGAPIERPSRPITDGNAPIGRPSLAGADVAVEPQVPTLSPVWSDVLTGDALDDTNLSETHWPAYDSKTGLRLEILSTLETQWQASLEASVSDWNAFDSVELTVTNALPEEGCEPVWGKIKLCNENFGETNWRSSIAVYFRSGNIVAASVEVNDFYTLDQGWGQYTLCHQLGHAIGLGNSVQLNCMRYVSLYSDDVSIQLQSPDDFIGELLFDAYGGLTDGQRRLRVASDRTMDNAEPFDRVVRYTV